MNIQTKEAALAPDTDISPNPLPDVPRVNDLVGPRLTRLSALALPVAGVGGILCALGLILSSQTFFQSYLYAFMFWFGITLGSTAWLLGHHVTGGGWGYILRRPLEAATRLWPWMLGMWVPILIAAILSTGVEYGFYKWANLDYLRGDAIMARKEGYLNIWTWTIRGLGFFLIWFGLAHFLNKWSRLEDRSDDPRIRHNLSLWSAVGLVFIMLTVTFSSIDWVMTIEPHWFSSLWGVIFLVGQGLSTLALMIILVRWLGDGLPLWARIESRYFRDVGNFLLAFTLLWAYTNYSQFMIQYSANLAEDAEWYVHRTTGGWQYWGTANIILHFVLPFAFLLMSITKVNPNNLVKLAGLVVVARFIDLFYYIVPTYRVTPASGLPGGAYDWAFLADIGAPLLLGGLWLWAWAGQMKKENAPLVPLFDARLRPYWPLTDAHGAPAPSETHETASPTGAKGVTAHG